MDRSITNHLITNHLITNHHNSCIIGPSHMLESNISKQGARKLFKDYNIFAQAGLANWSDIIPKYVKEAHKKNLEITWVVSNYLFNNDDINLIKELPTGNLFLPGARGSPGNICQGLMETEHVVCLASHTIEILDYIVEHFPKIKLVFWCLYQRTRNNLSKSIPYDYSYASMMNRYPNNAVDIDIYLKANNLQFSDCIIDGGGHPNYNGYTILKHCIENKLKK